MSHACDACGNAGDQVAELQELPNAPAARAGHAAPPPSAGPGAPAVHLCLNCLAAREAISWNLESPEGRRLMDALLSRPEAPSGQYSYLAEGENQLHLLHMRYEWLSERAKQSDASREPSREAISF